MTDFFETRDSGLLTPVRFHIKLVSLMFLWFSCFLIGASLYVSLSWGQCAWKGRQPCCWNRTRKGAPLLHQVVWCCSVPRCTGCFCSFPTLQPLIRFAFCSILVSSKTLNLIIFLDHKEYQSISLKYDKLHFKN